MLPRMPQSNNPKQPYITPFTTSDKIMMIPAEILPPILRATRA
jgi:hypothetical protein